MKKYLIPGGAVLSFFGLFFALQGLGVITWPSSSSMIRNIDWTYYGGAIAVLGVGLIYIGRRK